MAFDVAPVGIALGTAGPDGPNITTVNPALANLFGIDPAGLTGTELLFHLVADDRPRAAALLDALGSGAATTGREHLRANVRGEVRVLQVTATVDLGAYEHANDAAQEAETAASAPPPACPLVLHVVDVTDTLRAADRLAHATTHDAVTGLASRSLFEERVGHALRSPAVVHARTGVAVIAIGLDHFAEVNLQRGRSIGDRVLAALGRRIATATGAPDAVGRLGGDEFAAVVTAPSPEAALAIARKIEDAIAQPLRDPSGGLAVTASVGMAWSGTADESVDTLVAAACGSMTMAKNEGRNRTVGVVLDAAG